MLMKKTYEDMTREELIRELRLLQLRRQVTPHFLFNSLSVAMRLAMSTPKLAVRFLGHLALMYRYLLSYGNEYHVPVEQEVEMMMQYYELMSVRHVDSIRLEVSEKVSKLKGNPLPPLALQGLLENAIKHNTHTKENPLRVVLKTVQRDGEGDYLVMQNNIVPLMAKAESTKMGLAYMNETMRLLFDREVRVVDDGCTFTVMIPLIEQRNR